MRVPLPAELNLLAEISLFAGLDSSELEAVAAQMERRKFRPREVIYHKEDVPAGLYIILRGEAKTRIVLPDDRQITFHIFRPGGYFGMHSLLSEQLRSTDAVAISACDTLFFPRSVFLAFLESHPAASHELLRVMAGMYRAAVQRMQDLALLDVRSRVAKELVHLSGSTRGPEVPRATDVNISQMELASLVGATRESTNKWLRFFEHEGWVQLRRGNIVVLDPEKLSEKPS